MQNSYRKWFLNFFNSSLGVFTIENRSLSSAQWLHERDICGSSYESTHNFHLEMFKSYDNEFPLFSHKNPQLNSI